MLHKLQLTLGGKFSVFRYFDLNTGINQSQFAYDRRYILLFTTILNIFSRSEVSFECDS